MNRRTVLGGAAALGSGALGPMAAMAHQRRGRFQGMVLLDRSAPRAQSFAHVARRLGAQVAFTDGDLTDLWTQDLEQRWRAAPAMMAGLTRPGAVSFLQLMGQRNRMRLVVRIDHQLMQTGVRHDGFVPAPLAARARKELAADWITGAAGLVIADAVAGQPTAFSFETDGGVSRGQEDRFVSWLIAPVRAVPVSTARTA